MIAYLINQTNHGNKRSRIFKRHFTANNTLEGRHLHHEKTTLALGNPTYLWNNN